ncbi:hypothetical protein [Leisingera sp. ANG-Vp]|uniref:hypothetical protein n=1 Tax=Leisingera sp. ANG-Vp TaxID=1577896 RepID=UPI00068C1270|nr:hypothetical protein [Leisingera sp. ANG-Vp]
MTCQRLITAALIVFPAGACLAETTWNEPGKGTGILKASSVEIARDHTLMQISSTYDALEMQNPSHPLHGASGPCFGAVEVLGKTVSGSGVCAFTDRNGDKAVLRWTAERLGTDGAMSGRWTLTGGTGNWEIAQGSGTYSSLADPASGALTNKFTGRVTFP